MKIVLISDTHEQEAQVTIPPCDILIHAGDITYDGNIHKIREFNEWLGKQPAKHKIVIFGNHDLTGDPDHIRYNPESVKSLTNCILLNDSSVSIQDIRIHGSPVQPRFGFWAFNRDRGDEINEHWKLIPGDTDILVTHGPPFGILDKPFGKQPSVGCEMLAKRIDEILPKVCVFGHIHGGAGQFRTDTTLYVNASVVDETYKVVNNPYVVCSTCWNKSDDCLDCKDWNGQVPVL